MSVTKIIPRILGGLGNQLFCYAAARRLALVNNAELVIDAVSGFVRDRNYQRYYQLDHFSIPCRKATAAERLERLPRVRRYLKRAYNRPRPFEERAYIQQEGIDLDLRLLHVKPYGTVYLEGYWQSENYFRDVEQTIRADLRITPPTDTANFEMAARIRDCHAVAVHVRFFDTPDVTAAHNASADYYQRAIALIEEKIESPRYFLFSDIPEVVREKLTLPKGRVTLVSHNQGDQNDYADLCLMTQCRHFITANSSFSWWGAWLGDSAAKTIVTPKLQIKGKAAWGFKGLI
ncbi:MAG: alpha-1,2-fucosyltransferase, partial [Desulfobulbaceae bacterium]|nr:alpha-1,2-fucosyltransferase [Desulfobulbaceae bacterium]